MAPSNPFRPLDVESAPSGAPPRCGAVMMSSGAKTVSAGLFFFDVVTNIVVLREYFILGQMGSYKGADIKGFLPSFQKAFFYICLAFMLVDPLLTALAFKLKLPPEERPVLSAIFLPVVQFLRFVKGIFRTCSCARYVRAALAINCNFPSALETTESLETEALYAITAAMQSGPQLVLQTSVIVVVTFVSSFISMHWKPSAGLKLSIICSFLSACYNSGRACMYQISNQWSVIPNLAGIAGGLYTVGVMLLRCTVVASLLLEASFIYLVCYLVLGIGLCSYVNALLIAFSKRRKVCSWATQADILLNTYNTACIGPLYPILENDNLSSKRRLSLSVGIALGVAINMLPDVISILLVVIRKHTSCDTEWIDKEAVRSTFSCGLFKAYVTTGVLFSIVSCVTLFFITKRTPSHHTERLSVENPAHP